MLNIHSISGTPGIKINRFQERGPEIDMSVPYSGSNYPNREQKFKNRNTEMAISGDFF